jgi:DNA-binding response OmpR family regulator
MRILVVDDSPHARTILRLFLSAQGFEVITASLAQLAQRIHELLAKSKEPPVQGH